MKLSIQSKKLSIYYFYYFRIYEKKKTKTKVFKFRVLELLETKIFISSLYKAEDSIYMEQGFISASSVQAFIYLFILSEIA